LEDTQNWQIEFYADAQGRSDVAEYIDSLQDAEAAQVAMVLLLLREQGSALRMPYAKNLQGHKPLRELRSGSHRLFFFIHPHRRCIVLLAFRKQSERTKRRFIKKAEWRMHDFLEREG
jgi:hypothetical protein